MSSPSEDVIPPSVKREREASAAAENTKRRKTELVKKISQQEHYYFDSWREKCEQNMESTRDDIWTYRVSMHQAGRNHQAAFAAFEIPRMRQARKALDAAMQKYSDSLKRRSKEKRKLSNFEMVEKIHAGMVYQEQKEADVRRLQEKLDRAKERVREAEAAKNALIDGLNRLKDRELDSLIEEFEY